MKSVRQITFRTRGYSRGIAHRLVSPDDEGRMLKPFVFLEYSKGLLCSQSSNLAQSHSGIVSISYRLDCDLEFEGPANKRGLLKAGGLELFNAGGGAWHRGRLVGNDHVSGFQLWVALGGGLEDGLPAIQHIDAADLPVTGAVKVLVGQYQGCQSPAVGPRPMLLLEVTLSAGQAWTYEASFPDEVAWLFVHRGTLAVGETKTSGELIVFDEQRASVSVHAKTHARFLFGAASKMGEPLVSEGGSVHTSERSLLEAQQRISAMEPGHGCV